MQRLSVILVLLFAVIGYQLWNRSTPSAHALPYVADWQTAVAQADAEHKPILLIFGGDW